jgi:two-component system response regulator HydG
MTKQGTILVVDDNKGILTAVQMLLGTCFEKVITISTPNKIKATLHDENIDVVLLDMNFSAGINTGNEGLFWLSEIKKEDASIQVVLFTAYADIDLAVRGIKEGAADFVVKPWDNAKLLETLKTAYNIRTANRKGISIATDKLVVSKESGMFWGESNAMQQLRSLIEKVARTDANILVTGENGTGKEMLAREIHLLSNRKKETLVPVDMGAITETLFESELFGHVKGAFTDARADRPGKFEVANKGTLFLDEIGNLSYHLQAKLLTALQRRSIVRVGSNTPIPVNIRLICATNRDLQEMVQKGDFREDLLYRINTIHVEIPPLRERPEDIVPLIEIFLSKYTKIYGKTAMCLSLDAKEKLKAQPWFGNIRELEHTIEKAVIIAERSVLDGNDFDFPRAKY